VQAARSSGISFWSYQQVHVLGHDDKIVQQIMSFTAVVLQGLQEELAVGSNLKESPAIICNSCDEECS
jgi:hypothetical protein